MESHKTVSINRQELKEIVKSCSNDKDVDRFFDLFGSMEKPKAYWFHSKWETYLLMTALGFFLLTVKIAIEAFWRIK